MQTRVPTFHRESDFNAGTTMNAKLIPTPLISTAHPTDAALSSILEAQRSSWNRFSPGWEKWDAFTMNFLAEQGQAIVDAINPTLDDQILDLATGTGEPGLSLAERASAGRVVGLDAAEGMLRVASAKAEARGVRNYHTLTGDACDLPFDDASFDAVSCRLGLMFVPDLALALAEIHRVLKPGGVFATTVWAGPEHNPWITALVGSIKAHLEFPVPAPGAPGMFRCADRKALQATFESVGFSVEARGLIDGEMRCRSASEYWSFMNDVVPPVVATLSAADPRAVDEVERTLRGRLPIAAEDGSIRLRAGAHLVVLRK